MGDTFTRQESDVLVAKASTIFLEHFEAETCFERAIFFSWGCVIGDCTFCYMSTQPEGKAPVETKRTKESILAEFILAKHLGWDIGFFTGGVGVLKPDELEFLLKTAVEITGEKIWLSVGPVPRPLLERYKPYIKGVVGSTETINPVLHKKVCPSKPLKPYETMFEHATELGLKKAMTFIVGMGETKDDIELLKAFITKYGIDKIHIYGLIPQKGTPFEITEKPSVWQQAWWISNLRIAFPKLDIQCGIWEDRLEYIHTLLKAGANSISKFKATKLFGTDIARSIEEESEKAGREFRGTLTKIPNVEWDNEVSSLSIEQEMKVKILSKLDLYLKKMQKNVHA